MLQRRSLLAAGAAAALATPFVPKARAAKRVRMGLVAKGLGNAYFVACDSGAKQAAAELGDVEVIFTGPTVPTAEGQIEIINALIDQHLDAIAISAVDPDALVPACKKAMQRGIKIVSYDSAIAPPGRIVHLAPSSDALIGQTCVQMADDLCHGKGKIAILSGASTATNQNAWIAEMKQVLPQHPGLDLVATVYGDDLADKSYREAAALLQQYPDLKVIVAPTSVGIVAAGKLVEDQHLVGKVEVTGLGLPSELAGHVHAGSVPEFAVWNPVDLGYSITYIAVGLVRGEKGGPNTTMKIGRVGSVTFDDKGVGAMAKPMIFTKANVDQYAKIF